MKSRPDEQPNPQSTTHSAECAFVLENIEGFALDALDRFERGMVEHHLRWCASCQAEASRYERVVEQFPFAVTPVTEPGPGLKARLFERIEAEGKAAQRTPSRRTVERNPESPEARETSPGWWRYASAALIAPLALSLLIMGVWANSMRNDLNEQGTDLQSQAQLNQVLADGGQVVLYSVEKEKSCPTCHGSGQLGMSESNDMGMVLGWNFDPGKRHDVWAVSRDGDTMKMCELEVDPAGSVMQMFTFPDAPSDFTEVYITDEHGEMTYVSHLAQADDATPGDDTDAGSPIT
ncbi:MAG: anti-sigma factor [Chloroflexota bacterium]|nr:anti-sigma factor [Chloroflexota bacterium]